MKIVDRKAFLALPENTLFSKYEPCSFEELTIKGESWLHCDDFLTQGVVDAIECSGPHEWADKLFDSQENGTSMKMDFDCQGRDGCFDADQLFAVWELQDVEALIARLQLCLIPKSGIEIPTLCK